MDLDKDEVLTITEAAALLKVPKRWLYERTSNRTVPHMKLGHHVRFSRCELLEWARGHQVEIQSSAEEGGAEAAPVEMAVA